MSAAPPVLLVGAGPGDPDLLTLRAEAELAVAGLVVADEAVLDLALAFAPAAEVVAAAAADVADRLAAAWGEGRRAVRLYRGDPWLHRRYAGEAAALAERDIPTESVPGPAAELALLAEAGIAVHHRPLSVTVTLGAPEDLPASSPVHRTLVFETTDVAAALRRFTDGGASDVPAVTVPGGRVARPQVVVVGAVAAQREAVVES